MTSQRRIEANRSNAQKSTGPRTPEGKARSRLNALKHGLHAKHLILDGPEDEAEFHRFLRALRADFRPTGHAERQLVDQLAASVWRLQRCRRQETDFLNAHLPHLFDDAATLETLNALSLRESRVERSFYRALHEIERFRNVRSNSLDIRSLPSLP